MRLLFLAAALYNAVALALSIPSSSSPKSGVHDSRDILNIVEASNSNEVSLRFEAPCHGCFVGSDVGLIFDVAIRRTTEACGQGHILINGQHIEWSNTTAEGAVHIQATVAGDLGNRDLHASWTTACIDDQAQILSLRIHQIGHDVLNHDAGFTIAFRQEGQPEVLRLVGEPIDISQPHNVASQWTHPDRPKSVASAPNGAHSAQSVLDDEFLQLEALNSQQQFLQRLIGEKKHKIHQLLNDDFRELCSTIKKCDNLKCMFQTIINKLSDYAHLVSVHCLHHHPSPQEAVSSEEIDSQAESTATSGTSESPTYVSESTPSITNYESHDELLPISVSQHGYPSHSAIPSQSREAPPAPTPPYKGNGLPSPTPIHIPSYNKTSLPSPVNHHLPLPYYILISVLPPLLLITVVAGFILLALLRFHLLCGSLRHRVSCLASREERRTRRAYQRAARKHAWREWWNRYRRPNCSNDYEEKRTLILEQEDVLEDAMQHQITQIVTEHESQSELLRAEEGRARLYDQSSINVSSQSQSRHSNAMDFGATSSSSSSSAMTQVFRSLQRTDPHSVFPLHPTSSSSSSRSDPYPHQSPPSYDQELGDDIDVVDGFTYSATFGAGQPLAYSHTHMLADGYVERDSGDDTTPDSSVVDCSPRMSFDTGRSTFTLTTVSMTGKDGD